ncbi:hypothetical protein A2526_05425 [candidate division WOR-1 bacterium RIFOXYD2_FULL_36_8]|uniref:PorV/PorQ family protein n=1 Tax=candidate division WOR-1 bacterium RIFOXYB2_FULL_36_35 TaxID=1802578 RepID=A0A1F4SAM9_UNCSA|nr:MAG: hypothetical protein A2230_07360 [candidate division WOR-1 bacterium RIFOXYA2_FULL_36_21]OGC16803.1 MAG: hypothetical protein A2290_07960 [candidate division WOR-1 bacterium RIFOXYB2_FULL_36_35]OGC19818.1 MAG: hypothetical protein A2282_01110 [candidate division WOR-1 bacterium RIFOXYA12_FULL_36_13]OGC37309.1 MAG: hypothetical protein A2526_05425 [candidate division WOR-1 bacterium RIFOXYD2_FULL_36_8]
MIKNLAIILISFLLLVSPVLGESYTVDISQTGVGARPIALGKAFVGVPDGSNAIAFNPASIAFTPHFEITSMQTKLLDTVEYKMFGSVVSTKIGNIGFNYVSAVSPAGYETTDQSSLSNATPINYESSMMILSYAMNMRNLIQASNIGYLSFGVNAKIINNKLNSSNGGSGSGIDADIGMLLITPKDFNFGICAQNMLGGEINWDSGNKDIFPALIRFGGSYNWKRAKTLITCDGVIPLEENHPLTIHAGVEWTPIEYFSLRAGLDQDALGTNEVIHNFTYGVGLNYKGLTFDYAYKQKGVYSDISTHYISLSYMP